MTYAEMMLAVDEIRQQTEFEEQQLRKFIQESVKNDNLELANAQRDRNRVLNNRTSNLSGDALLTSLPAFDEDKLLAMDASGRVIRRDMFKGFTEEQKRKILLDNQSILQQRSLQREDDKRREYDWMMQQLMALRAMEQAEYEEKQVKDHSQNRHLSYLRDQVEEQRRRKEEWEKAKYGDIRGGFFDGFGKTCR
jgi:hypothetical protein